MEIILYVEVMHIFREQNIATDTVTNLSQGKTPNLVVMDLDSEQLKSISYDDAFGIPQIRMMATNVR